jgi:hypothetical protein
MNAFRDLESTLFGRRDILSDRKLFTLLMRAATDVYLGDVTGDLLYIYRPAWRQWKKIENESGDTTDEEEMGYESDNEGKRNL